MVFLWFSLTCASKLLFLENVKPQCSEEQLKVCFKTFFTFFLNSRLFSCNTAFRVHLMFSLHSLHRNVTQPSLSLTIAVRTGGRMENIGGRISWEGTGAKDANLDIADSEATTEEGEL